MKAPPALETAPLISDWIVFGPDRMVELRTGRVELGQGAVTAILQIAAAELGLDPREMTVVSGDTDRTPDEGLTVGSLSVSQGGAAVAWAGSAARRVILAEAARRLNVAAEDLTVDNGRIVVEGAASKFDLRDIGAGTDLALPIVDYGVPGAGSGPDLPRIDLPERILGTPFVHDLCGPEALFGRVLHPPSRDAKLLGLDEEALVARSGIVRVVRNGQAVGVIGEGRAAVDAAAAAAANEVRWEIPEPDFGDLRAFLRARSEDRGTPIHQAGALPDGDPVEIVATRGYLSHGSIGPAAASALWQDGHLTVESPTQGVFALRAALAGAFGLAEEAITVRHRPGAGCYGHNGTDDAAADATFLARAVPGREVHVVWGRQDEFRAGPVGTAMACRVRFRLSEGRVAGAHITVASPPHSSRPGTGGAPCLITATRFDPPVPFPQFTDVPAARGGGADRNALPYYAIPNVAVDKVLVHDLPFRTSSPRGLGAHLNIYAIELAIDAAARHLNADPVKLRLDHLDDPRARAVIERVVRDGLPETSEESAWGLGFGRYKNTAAYCAVALELTMGERLAVRRARVALDTGRIVNRDGTLNQVEGGLLQAISWTLFEELPLNGTSIAASSWEDYPILRFSDVPDEVEIELIDRPDAPPLGCAEALQGPTAAAIGTAARALFFQPLPDLPLTRDRIAAALAAQ